MQKQWWGLGVAGLALIISACASETLVSQKVPPAPTVVSTPSAAMPTDPSNPQTVSIGARSDRSSASRAVAPGVLSVPNLTIPTSALNRLPQVRAGRSDPFGSLNPEPTVVAAAPATVPAAGPAPAVAPPAPVILNPAPAVPQNPAPVISTVPVARAQAPAAAPTVAAPAPLAQTIEISGVMQVGNRVHVIVRVPQESTSRTVGAGEYLANGTVLVKRIEMQANREPRVILEQNGVETVRTVGDSSSLMSSL